MARLTYTDLCTSSKAQLEQYLKDAKAPALESLSGYEFRGYNVLAAHEKAVMSLLGGLRFIKCFFPAKGTAASGTQLQGYNLKIKNGGLNEPWTAIPNEEKPNRLGYYKAYPTRNRPGENPYPNAMFLDYAQPENGLFTGKTIDDYVVQPDIENPDLLIGKAYTRLGFMTPTTYFILERLQKHNR